MTDSLKKFADSLPELGEKVEKPVVVSLSNELVTLLSDQLYQSPLKAIEELVVNSFDAAAKECRVFVPPVIAEVPFIAVFDNGIGMDDAGLADLWHIAKSRKRDSEYQKKVNRKQIGKFGIGKLATYAIANKITYISRTGEIILAVSADFQAFHEEPNGPTELIKLPVTKITWQVLEKSEVFTSACSVLGLELKNLFSADQKTWTIVILEDLKPDRISQGKLKWVLSTAMPLQKDFRLYLNKIEITSSKENLAVLVNIDISTLPSKRLNSLKEKTGETWQSKDGKLYSSSFPSGISGNAIVTEQSLHTGTKSEDLGRSHGFFVRVLGRLINEGDPLFGLSPLSFQTFNRFHADIVADDLDKVLTAPREGIGESTLKNKIVSLLEEVFYESREKYEEIIKKKDEAERRAKEHERNYVPPRLVEYPIADVLTLPSAEEKSGAEADGTWFYLDIPSDEELKAIIKSLYTPDRKEKYKYTYVHLGKTSRVVRLNPQSSTFSMNLDHDLVMAYYDEPMAKLLLEDLATAEAVLEVYLRELGVPSHISGEILERRDALLRGLAKDHVFSTALISQYLMDSQNNESDLEVALIAAARALGFVAKHISGPGEPDGLARFVDYPTGEKIITLEAKSSIDVPNLSQLDFAGLEEHVRRNNANGCLLIAPRYPGAARGEESAVAQRANSGHISCWTVEQLANVTRAAEIRQITAQQILDIILNHFAPEEVTVYVNNLLGKPEWAQRSLYTMIINALKKLENKLTDNPRTISHIATVISLESEYQEVKQNDIHKAMRELAAASQGTLIVLPDDRIVLNASIDEIERRVQGLTGNGGEPRRLGTFRNESSD